MFTEWNLNVGGSSALGPLGGRRKRISVSEHLSKIKLIEQLLLLTRIKHHRFELVQASPSTLVSVAAAIDSPSAAAIALAASAISAERLFSASGNFSSVPTKLPST